MTGWSKTREVVLGGSTTGRLARTTALCGLLFLISTQAPVLAVDGTPNNIASDGGTTAKRTSVAGRGLLCTTVDDCPAPGPCMEAACVNHFCEVNPIPDCVPCFGPPNCPPVEIVFLMDTSGSMRDEAAVICTDIGNVVDALSLQGIVVLPHFFGITEVPPDGFSCLTDNVVSLLGGSVPGNLDTCPFPDTFSAHESWGPATSIVADRFPWTPGSQRVIVPISDEGACDGSFPDGCNDPGDDRDSITNAIAVAGANNVIVSPIAGTSSSACVLTLAADLAAGTGGMSFSTQDPTLDLAAGITTIILDICEPAPCDDGDPCTADDLCIDGVCIGTPLPGCVRCVTDEECVGADACSIGVCIDGVCASVDNYDPETDCCDPETGDLTPIDDGNICTDDVCDPVTGQVTHPPTPEPIPCDDGDPCTTDVCVDGICVGTEISCTDLDDECAIGVCNAKTGECEAQPTNEGQPCTDDENPCTDDFCASGICVHENDDTNSCADQDICTADACVAGECISSPTDCSHLDDECLVGVCNDQTGVCEAQPTNEGGPCTTDDDACTDDICQNGSCEHLIDETNTCTDGDICTYDDHCVADGTCAGTPVSSVACTTDADCPGDPSEVVCNLKRGVCDCGDSPELCLSADETCAEVGEEIGVVLSVSYSQDPVSMGQFLVEYDPAAFAFVGIDPAPGWHEETAFRQVDEVQGTVFFVMERDVATRDATPIATLRFRALEACSSMSVCMINDNPVHTRLTGTSGLSITYVSCCEAQVAVNGGTPQIECPPGTSINAEPGRLAATVTWDSVSVIPACDGPVDVSCTATHSGGWNIDAMIANGGLLPSGVSTFECTVTDGSCGGSNSCSWVVNVSSANTVSVDLQLSPTILNPGPLVRCIEFEFYADCVAEPEVFRQEVTFGLPLDLAGNAKGVLFKVPANKYRCVTARDPLHTLRAVANLDIDGDRWAAVFQGDPSLGGNWLIGGNVDGSRVIDILDLAIVRAAMQTVDDPNTNCARTSTHADINGDGIVDSLDELFVTINFLSEDKETCCPGAVLASFEKPVIQISVDELRRTGRGNLAAGDTNGDGWLNLDDLKGPMINAPLGAKRAIDSR